MERIHLPWGALLAGAALLGAGPGYAQAHGPSSVVTEPPAMDPAASAAANSARLAELEIWLSRLTGHFRYEGVADPGLESAQGIGHCIGIGTGPGVHCVINVTWPSTKGDPGLATLEPAMMLYGIDTNEAGIRSLQVNSKGLPEGALGFLNGNVATFRPQCVNRPAVPACRRFVRIEAAPAGNFVYVREDTELFLGNDWVRVAGLVLSLRRLPGPGTAR